MTARSRWRLLLLPRHLLALLARLGERNGNRLLAAFHLAAFSALAALRFSSLVAVHLALHFGAGAGRIFPFPLLGHTSLLDNRCCQNNGVAPGGERAITCAGSLARLRNCRRPRRVWVAYGGACHESAAFPSPTPTGTGCHRPYCLRG